MTAKLIEKQTIFQGSKVRLELHHLRDLESDRNFKREVVVHPGAVVILGFLDRSSPDAAAAGADRIMLIRNRRYAVGQTLLELPAGTLEKDEDPMNCAGREMVEETGYLPARLIPIGAFYSSPGVLSEKLYAFAAYDLQPSHQSLDEGEELELAPTEWADALEMIRDGSIADGKTIATLLKFDKFHHTAAAPESSLRAAAE